MNQRGTLTAWNDAKGFGFITPAQGGDRIFAHISNYAGRGRPVSNRKVTYSVARDRNGRLRAGAFQYAGASRIGASVSPGVWLAAFIVLVFFVVLMELYDRGVLPAATLAVYGVVSLVTFVMYWIDKRAAIRGAQRTPENTLHLLELLCGWPGAVLAQHIFRHKTRKGRYQFIFWLAVLINMGALGWLFVAPEAMAVRQQLGFESLRALAEANLF